MMEMKEFREVPQDDDNGIDVVVTQPQPTTSGNIADGATSTINNCPRGLEYLASVDQLLVSQKVENLEVYFGIETENKFKVKNSLGQNVYFAYEESDSCERDCLGSDRSFELKIVDNFQNEVMQLSRACTCCCGEDSLVVSAPPGHSIGTLEQASILTGTIHVKNSSGDVMFRIKTPSNIFGDKHYKVRNSNDEVIGKITKQWSGLGRELFTDADYFSVTFPLSLEVRLKALLFGAVFLIDALYYEN